MPFTVTYRYTIHKKFVKQTNICSLGGYNVSQGKQADTQQTKCIEYEINNTSNMRQH